eukprot:SM000057S18372  [mRNA]  locus=s57:209995:217420:- [translate_table: standard]
METSFVSSLADADRPLGVVRITAFQHQAALKHAFRQQLRISSYTAPSDRLQPLLALHTTADSGLCFKLTSTASRPELWRELGLVHGVCKAESKTAVALLDEEREVHLVPVPPSNPDDQRPQFWGYVFKVGLYATTLSLLNTRTLGLVLDLDETLLVANAAKGFDDKIENVKRKIRAESDQAKQAALEGELLRLQGDRALLKQYSENDQIEDNGHIIKADSEVVQPVNDGTLPILRPIIRLPEKQLVLTRIDPTNRDTSVLVKLRPAWEELRSYILHKDRKRFEPFVCTMAEREYALEMWRLLDPDAKLIPLKEQNERVVTVRAGKKKALEHVFARGRCSPKLALTVDDRLDVWEEADQSRVHVLPAFLPYSQPQNEVPVLAIVRNVACNVRANFFREVDDTLSPMFADVTFHTYAEKLPSEIDVGAWLKSADDIPYNSKASGQDTDEFAKAAKIEPRTSRGINRDTADGSTSRRERGIQPASMIHSSHLSRALSPEDRSVSPTQDALPSSASQQRVAAAMSRALELLQATKDRGDALTSHTEVAAALAEAVDALRANGNFEAAQALEVGVAEGLQGSQGQLLSSVGQAVTSMAHRQQQTVPHDSHITRDGGLSQQIRGAQGVGEKVVSDIPDTNSGQDTVRSLSPEDLNRKRLLIFQHGLSAEERPSDAVTSNADAQLHSRGVSPTDLQAGQAAASTHGLLKAGRTSDTATNLVPPNILFPVRPTPGHWQRKIEEIPSQHAAPKPPGSTSPRQPSVDLSKEEENSTRRKERTLESEDYALATDSAQTILEKLATALREFKATNSKAASQGSVNLLNSIAQRIQAKLDYRLLPKQPAKPGFRMEVDAFGQVLGKGFGRSRKEAKHHAAEQVLQAVARSIGGPSQPKLEAMGPCDFLPTGRAAEPPLAAASEPESAFSAGAVPRRLQEGHGHQNGALVLGGVRDLDLGLHLGAAQVNNGGIRMRPAGFIGQPPAEGAAPMLSLGLGFGPSQRPPLGSAPLMHANGAPRGTAVHRPQTQERPPDAFPSNAWLRPPWPIGEGDHPPPSFAGPGKQAVRSPLVEELEKQFASRGIELLYREFPPPPHLQNHIVIQIEAAGTPLSFGSGPSREAAMHTAAEHALRAKASFLLPGSPDQHANKRLKHLEHLSAKW